jgi:phosphoribosyl 1,2-cyclic phosphate phosphodiesterase
MLVHFLGTAAFEGIPSLFCTCELCVKAKAAGGKNIRTRTSVLFDNELKVDFPPDTLLHMLRDGIDMEDMKDLIITHTHSDHLYPDDLVARLPGYAQAKDHTIHVYGNDAAIRIIHDTLVLNGGDHGKFELHRVRPFERTELRTAVVTALPASHNPMETCYVYYIEKNGKTVFYGHDSGRFPEETWRWLEGKPVDLAILECTMGNIPYDVGHMNVEAVLDAQKRMAETGMLRAGAKIAVTHFSHNAHLLHEDLTDIFAPHGIEVAFDGMRLEI